VRRETASVSDNQHGVVGQRQNAAVVRSLPSSPVTTDSQPAAAAADADSSSYSDDDDVEDDGRRTASVGGPGEERPRRRRRRRTAFSSDQLVELEREFAGKKYLSLTERSLIARQLRLSEVQVGN